MKCMWLFYGSLSYLNTKENIQEMRKTWSSTDISAAPATNTFLPAFSPAAYWGAAIWTWSPPPWTVPSCHRAWRPWQQSSCQTRPWSRSCWPPEPGFPRTAPNTEPPPWKRSAAAPPRCCCSSCCWEDPPAGPCSVIRNLTPPHVPLPEVGEEVGHEWLVTGNSTVFNFNNFKPQPRRFFQWLWKN